MKYFNWREFQIFCVIADLHSFAASIVALKSSRGFGGKPANNL